MTNFKPGTFNGDADPAKRTKPRSVVHRPSRAAQRDDIDATMDRIVRDIVERDRKRFPRERAA